MKSRMNDLFKEQRDIHILYSYNGKEQYLEKLIDFVQSGVIAGDYVILIENQRIYKTLHQILITRLSEEQMKLVQWVNNFDFYFSSGSYHPPAIYNYFVKTVQNLVDDKLPFRSWAHVEWATMEGPLHIIEDLERIVDKAVNELDFPLVCAYERTKMPKYLRKILLETHPYILVEDELVVSEVYKSTLKR
ncbi:MEDS domain-containing protein [Sutcliffiella horikoshii]|uniref:MEDS domain-containing protein n=1 Tax=Sutcliffiella horikoshii TaxID=79883 RepID=UPI001CFED1E8|nr:MEDS domain-containing protein [Sutcliffiella horikoshii]